jgi:hypothetical protein
VRYRSRFEKIPSAALGLVPVERTIGCASLFLFVTPWQARFLRMKQQSLPLLGRIHRHRPKIVLGMLEIILRRDPVSRESFGAGQNQIALIVSLRALSVSRRAGGTERLMFTGGLVSLRRRAGGKLRIWAQPCRYRFRFRNLFHVGPYVAAAEPCDLHSRNCRVAAPSRERCSKGSDRTTRARCERWGWLSIQNTKAQPNESTSTAFYIGAQMPISSCRAKVPGKPKG